MEQKYKIVLPRFEKWEDVYDYIYDRYPIETVEGFVETLQAMYPHGIRVGDKYIQR